MLPDWCAICGGEDDDEHMSMPHCFESVRTDVMEKLRGAANAAASALGNHPAAQELQDAVETVARWWE